MVVLETVRAALLSASLGNPGEDSILEHLRKGLQEKHGELAQHFDDVMYGDFVDWCTPSGKKNGCSAHADSGPKVAVRLGAGSGSGGEGGDGGTGGEGGPGGVIF